MRTPAESEVGRWLASRRFDVEMFPPERIQALKGDTSIAVIVPTRECAATIDGVLSHTVGPAAEAGLVDELVVIDAASVDGTAAAAAAALAQIDADVESRVVQQDEVLPHLGAALGKGDAMWRALALTEADVVCFLDGDTLDPDPRHLNGLIGPLLLSPDLILVKGSFDRPLTRDGIEAAHEGGRVTELMARPLLNLREPRLAGFTQPLAGEVAARRSLLEAIPFPTGYGVEIAMLLDALAIVGLDAIAECHLGTRHNRHQPLRALGEMAYAVLVAVERRCRPGTADTGGRYLRPWEDGALVEIAVDERPPLASIVALTSGQEYSPPR